MFTSNMATIDELIEEILAEYEPRFIFDQPIPEDEEGRLPWPLRPQRPFTDLDDQVPPPVRLPADQWVEILNDTNEGNFILRLKFLRENDDDWVLEDKFDTVRTERKKGQGVIEISRDTKPGVLTGIDSVFYQNAYPVTAVAYGLYPIRDPDPANLAPLRDGNLNCLAQRVVEHFEGTLRGQGLTPTRRQKIQEWEDRVHKSGATVEDVADLEKILKRAIVLRDIAAEDIYNCGKYQRGGSGVRGKVELIIHNGHAW